MLFVCLASSLICTRPEPMDLVGLFNDEAEISTEGRTAGGNTVNTEPFTHSPDDNVVE